MSLCLRRKSVRKFLDSKVSDDMIERLMMSAMQAPSARNQQPWRFIVIKNPELLEKLGGISKGAWPLKEAPLGILTMIDLPEGGREAMCPQDLAASTQNILLEATHQGLGAVWIGVYPLEDRMEKVKEIVGLDKDDQPFSLVAVGFPESKNQHVTYRYDPARVQVIE